VSHLGYFTRETLISLRRNVMMTVSGIITIAIGATIVSSMLLFIKGNDRAAAKVRGNVQLAIFFDSHEVPAEVQAVQRSLDELKRSGEVKSYQYLDHKAAYAEAKKLFQADPDALLDVTPNDLPVNFHVSLRDASQVENVARQFSGRPGVNEVTTPARFIEPFFRDVNRMRAILSLVATALIVASVFLVVMTVRLATYARRREIEVMKLVGASNLFVRVPFLAEGIVQGIIGGGIAFGLTFVARSVFNSMNSNTAGGTSFLVLHGFQLLSSDAMWFGLIVLIGSALVGLVSAMIGLYRFLDV
jgi:cell division transport system permease protein